MMCSNIGDQAINKAFTELLEKKYNADVLHADYTSGAKSPLALRENGRKANVALRKFIKKLLPLNSIWIIRNFKRISQHTKNEPDLIIIGGGQLFLPGRFTFAAGLWVWSSRKRSIPIVFSNIGATKNRRIIEKIILKYVCKHASGILFRDEKSWFNICQTVGFKIKKAISNDIVFTDESFDKKSIFQSNHTVLLGVVDFNVYKKYNKKISVSNYYDIWFNFLKDVNYSEVTLIYTTAEDYRECIKFNNYVRNKYGVYFSVGDYDTLYAFEMLLKNSSELITARMHAAILGEKYNLRVTLFPMSEKLLTYREKTQNNRISDICSETRYTTQDFLEYHINKI